MSMKITDQSNYLCKLLSKVNAIKTIRIIRALIFTLYHIIFSIVSIKFKKLSCEFSGIKYLAILLQSCTPFHISNNFVAYINFFSRKPLILLYFSPFLSSLFAFAKSSKYFSFFFVVILRSKQYLKSLTDATLLYFICFLSTLLLLLF